MCESKLFKYMKSKLPAIPTKFQISELFQKLTGKTKVVKVFNSLFSNTGECNLLLSPGFNGCHGVGIFSNNKFFFGHYPPVRSEKMKAAIKENLSNFASDCRSAKIILVSPTSKTGCCDKEFGEYLSLIKQHFNNDIQVEMLRYPERNKGFSWQFVGKINGNSIFSKLEKVKN